MSTRQDKVEDKVRAVFFELAEQIEADSAPPLRLPARPAGQTRPARPARRTSQGRRWLAPAAAAASLLTVAIGAAALSTLSHARSDDQTGQPQSVRRVLAEEQQVPRYYIGETTPASNGPPQAAIYATYTGARVATIILPPGLQVADVSAAADDTTFAIAARPYPDQGNVFGPAKFYLVRLDAATRSATLISLASLGMPVEAPFIGLALSPDGKKLAAAFGIGNTGGELRVVGISTGTARVWRATSTGPENDTADPAALSWAADSTTLAVNLAGARTRGLCLLNTSQASGDLVRACPIDLPTALFTEMTRSGVELTDIAVLTPDGRGIVAGATTKAGTIGGFAQWSATTGHLLSKTDWRTMQQGQGGPTDVLWSNPAGSTLVVYAPPGHPNKIGILSSGRLTLLPTSPSLSQPTAAW